MKNIITPLLNKVPIPLTKPHQLISHIGSVISVMYQKLESKCRKAGFIITQSLKLQQQVMLMAIPVEMPRGKTDKQDKVRV